MTNAEGHVVWRAYYKAWGGLYYNTFRYYVPAVGRFTTQDPIGLMGGDNLYRYAPNALGWIDLWGLSACAPIHHLATNKHSVWDSRFRKLFEENNLGRFKNGTQRKDILNDPLNKVDVPGHKGPHPERMYEEIFKRHFKC
jgi:RHS repeat-associated protein